jgi:hypothetical protein
LTAAHHGTPKVAWKNFRTGLDFADGELPNEKREFAFTNSLWGKSRGFSGRDERI